MMRIVSSHHMNIIKREETWLTAHPGKSAMCLLKLLHSDQDESRVCKAPSSAEASEALMPASVEPSAGASAA